MTDKKPNISLFFPVYNDETTVRLVANRALALLEEVAENYEVIIVNPCSIFRPESFSLRLVA